MTDMPPLIKRKIVFRVVLGYLLALSFTVGIVFLAFTGLNKINHTVNDITNRLTTTRTLAQGIANNLQLVRYYAERYQRLYRQEDLDLFNKKILELQENQQSIELLISDPDILNMVQHIQKETYQYIDGFEEITKLIMHQQLLLSTSFLKQEILVENQFSAIRINVGFVQIPNIYFSFGNAKASFELMRLYQFKYMSGNDEKYFIMFKNNFILAIDAFSDLIHALDTESNPPEVVQKVLKAQDELQLYYETFLKIHSTKVTLKKLSKKLQQHELEVAKIVARITRIVEDEYKKNNHLTQTLVLNTQLQLLAAVFIAILINLGLIWVVLRKIITPIFQELQQRSTIDSLTMVANRRAFDIGIEKEAKRAKKEKQPLSLLMCDVDFFKNYNDSYGHQQGDLCLQKIAATISNQCNRTDHFVSRYGGEEFTIILPNTSVESAIKIANTMTKSIESLKIVHQSSQVSKFVTLSMGVATMIADENNSTQTLIHHADKALYQAKNKGRNCAVQYAANGL